MQTGATIMAQTITILDDDYADLVEENNRLKRERADTRLLLATALFGLDNDASDVAREYVDRALVGLGR